MEKIAAILCGAATVLFAIMGLDFFGVIDFTETDQVAIAQIEALKDANKRLMDLAISNMNNSGVSANMIFLIVLICILGALVFSFMLFKHKEKIESIKTYKDKGFIDISQLNHNDYSYLIDYRGGG